jgi:hypothetical protein
MSAVGEVHTTEPTGQALVRREEGTLQLLQRAVEQGASVETLERLEGLYERAKARDAAAEFAEAFASFQAECPPIAKRKTATVATKSGGTWTYKYADLDTIVRVVGPLLRKYGFSYTWDSETSKERMLACRCTLRHIGGHSITASFSTPTESTSPVNDQQKAASALTYARRQSLIAVLGLTTCDPDTDGNDPTPITEQQASDLDAMIEEVGASKARFLKSFEVGKIAQLPARMYDVAVQWLKEYAEGKAAREAAAREAADKGRAK